VFTEHNHCWLFVGTDME